MIVTRVRTDGELAVEGAHILAAAEAVVRPRLRDPSYDPPVVTRPVLFVLVGLTTLTYWVVVRPTHDESASQDEWSTVLGFSGLLLAVGVGIAVLGQLFAGRRSRGLSRLYFFAAAAACLVNVVEDGFQVDSAFIVFVLCATIMLLSLAGLTVAVALGPRQSRVLALVALGTLLGTMLFVDAGGPILLATWLTAAALCSRAGGQLREGIADEAARDADPAKPPTPKQVS